MGVQAQEQGGAVFLDLDEDAPNEVFEGLKEEKKTNTLSEIAINGYNYVQDVKNYDELLPGEAIEKDFSEDMQQKYPQYDEKAALWWQNSVRKGVKAYRWYKDIKEKVKNWVLNYELPVVVDDDQYEMGGDEEYIESDKPVVRTNFKKIIAYSNQHKDQLAVQERVAKQNNLPLPSQAIKWYRENIAKGNWKELIKGVWQSTGLPEQIEDEPRIVNNDFRYMMFLRNNSWDKDGYFDGVLRFNIPNGKFMLLNSYQNYQGLSVNFEASENVEQIDVFMTHPQVIKTKNNHQVLFYADNGDVYFKGKVKQTDKPMVLRVKGSAPVCKGDQCEQKAYFLEAQVTPTEELKPSTYSYYVGLVSRNVPRSENAKKFDIIKTAWEQELDGKKYLKVEFECDDLHHAGIFLIGDNAKYFSAPKIDMLRNTIVARFELIDKAADDVKSVKIWLSDGEGRQYIADREIETESIMDTDSGKANLGWFLVAVWSGVLLNFISGGVPLLLSKFRNMTEFGGKNRLKIRKEWGANALGIGCVFVIAAALAMYWQWHDKNPVWGVQFQNVGFLMAVVWYIVFILWVFKGRNLILSAGKKVLRYRFATDCLVGGGIAILALVCGGPHWGDLVQVAGVSAPWVMGGMVIGVGIGMSLPYLLGAIFPQIFKLAPSNYQWRKLISWCIAIVLILLLVWQLVMLGALISLKMMIILLISMVVVSLLVVYARLIINSYNNQAANKAVSKRHNMRVSLVMCVVIMAIIAGNYIGAVKTDTTVAESEFVIDNIDKINVLLKYNRKILIKFENNGCLLCKYNEWTLFRPSNVKDAIENNNVSVKTINVITDKEKGAELMKRFNFKSAPMYVFFSKYYRDGVVLPQHMDTYELINFMNK